MKQQSDFIPNTFTHPNAYVDRLMGYLEPEENTVLTYLVRRIFGFRKRTDRVALSQFVDGIKGSDGQYFDHGTGLSKEAVRKALGCLIAFNIVIVEGPATNDGTEYSLQLDSEAVNWPMIYERQENKAALGKRRTAAALIKRGILPPIYGGEDEGEGGMSDMTPHVPHDAGGHVPHDEGGNVPHPHNIQGNPEKSSIERQPKTAGARDPRLDHPAIILVKQVMRRYPNKAGWDKVIEALGTTPDAEKFKKVFETWTLRGYKPTNLEGILNWYKTGIPEPSGKFPRASRPAPTPQPTGQLTPQEIEAKRAQIRAYRAAQEAAKNEQHQGLST